MYTGVTPLRQELLETLNRLLVSSPANMRDLIANTVPIRLTHLLRYSMKPLVYPKSSEGNELLVFSSVEHLKPVETIAYLVENPEVVLRGSSFTHSSPCFAPLVVTNLTHDVYRSYATASGAPQDPE